MSTAHIYGDPPEVVCDEASPPGFGLAPTVGRAWEEAFAVAALPSQRGVILRTSFVIGRPNSGGAGALGTLARLARWGLGGAVGSGRQGMSWLHERDMNRIFERALADEAMRGVYVATAPEPVSQREFMRALRRHAGGLGAAGVGLPAPGFLVRIAAPLLLRTDPELALYGRYAVPRRLLDAGFQFEFPALGPALAELSQPRSV
jgi:NAD dependent epimerase/dehydratase family enzyme